MEENILGFGFSISVLGQNVLVFNQRLKDFNSCGFMKFLFCYFFKILNISKRNLAKKGSQPWQTPYSNPTLLSSAMVRSPLSSQSCSFVVAQLAGSSCFYFGSSSLCFSFSFSLFLFVFGFVGFGFVFVFFFWGVVGVVDAFHFIHTSCLHVSLEINTKNHVLMVYTYMYTHRHSVTHTHLCMYFYIKTCIYMYILQLIVFNLFQGHIHSNVYSTEIEVDWLS